MELFSAAGIELPPSGARARRAPSALVRSLRVPLFNYKVVQNARERAAFAPSTEQTKAAQDYARKIKDPKFLKKKETAVRPLFIQEILQIVLGYRQYDPSSPIRSRMRRRFALALLTWPSVGSTAQTRPTRSLRPLS